MDRRFQAGAVLAVAILAGVAGFYLSRGSLTSPVVEQAAERLMLLSLSDTSGNLQRMSQWRGKVLVLNFWATWCSPCRDEIPALIRVKRNFAANGVQFVGIAADDVSKVLDYAKEMHIDYVLLIGGIEALDVTKDLGNRGGILPFTIVLDRAGKMAYAHAGPLTETSLSAILSPLL